MGALKNLLTGRRVGRTIRADDRRVVANSEGNSRTAQFGAGWAATATNPESASVARYHEREWGRP